MAEIIAPEEWCRGLKENRFLPSKYSVDMFKGKGVNICNNADPNSPKSACRVWDIVGTDYITDYDDRRINGLAGANSEGRDGWGASAYGVFQDVRFASRLYTMGRHRSMALRVFDEAQYAGPLGQWGDEVSSYISTSGQAMMNKAQMLNDARELWEEQVLGPDQDKYNIFAACNGHMTGRWVADDPDRVIEPDASKGKWVAQPGTVIGEAIAPSFAPIHCIDWDEENIPQFLNNITVTWDNLFIPQNDRCIYMDGYYRYQLMAVLTSKGVPSTEAAYADVKDGQFSKLMGWDFDFSVPAAYWPKLYVDDNLNVVHSVQGNKYATDALMHSVAVPQGMDPGHGMFYQLSEAMRTNQFNYIRTEWKNGKFIKTVTNYPLGSPAMEGFFFKDADGDETDLSARVVSSAPAGLTNAAYYAWNDSSSVYDPVYAAAGDGKGDPFSTKARTNDAWGAYPWNDYGDGIGFRGNGPVLAEGEAALQQVIGLVLYRPAVQLSQYYSGMVTDEGKTRGKFTEMCYDVKYDAWVIENMSHGVMPILDGMRYGTDAYDYAMPVKVVAD